MRRSAVVLGMWGVWTLSTTLTMWLFGASGEAKAATLSAHLMALGWYALTQRACTAWDADS